MLATFRMSTAASIFVPLHLLLLILFLPAFSSVATVVQSINVVA
jgi:hypothetical protein